VGNPDQQEVRRQFEKFLAKSKTRSLDQHAKDQLARELPGLKKKLDDAVDLEAKIIKYHLDIKAMKIKPVNHRKAASLLKISSQHESRLKKALELDGPAREKALDALAKELKLKTAGKDMIAILKNAGVLFASLEQLAGIVEINHSGVIT
jgi:hypothetical protein